ncbi:hypothetical protein MMPV_004625 [Pyropia vietnamensis]
MAECNGQGPAVGSTSCPSSSSIPTGVPVYVALPADALLGDAWVAATATAAAARTTGEQQLPGAVAEALAAAAAAGAAGVAVDLWWGAVEAAPRVYDWAPAVALVRAAATAGLQVQANLCFHSPVADGGDGRDEGGEGEQVARAGKEKGQPPTLGAPLPGWVVEAATAAGLWHVDAQDRVHTQSLSLAADTVPFLPSFAINSASGSGGDNGNGSSSGHIGGYARRRSSRRGPLRTALTAVGDALRSFLTALPDDVATTVGRVQLGAGPHGELAYPAHVPPPAGDWAHPGVGSFVCHSPRSVAAAAAAAAAAGVPASWAVPPSVAAAGTPADRPWGYLTWASRGGAAATPAGRFFLRWYGGALMDHADGLLRTGRVAAHEAGVGGLTLVLRLPAIPWWRNTACRAAEATAGLVHLPHMGDGGDGEGGTEKQGKGGPTGVHGGGGGGGGGSSWQWGSLGGGWNRGRLGGGWAVDPYAAVAGVAACHGAEVCLGGAADARSRDAPFWTARSGPEALWDDVATAAARRGVRVGAASTTIRGRPPAGGPAVCGHPAGCAAAACRAVAYGQVVRSFRAVPRRARGVYVVDALPLLPMEGREERDAAQDALADFVRRMRAL